MARLTALDKAEALSEARPLYELDDERYGQVLNNTRVYAHNPAVLRAIKIYSSTVTFLL